MGNSFSECLDFLGFDFLIGTDESQYAGMYQYPNIILTQRQNHNHELVHALIRVEYPDILEILNEGMPTYYGGTSGFDYETLRNRLKNYVKENSVDLSEFSSFNTINLAETTKIYYVVGALIIEYALKNYGVDKVIELFSCKDYQDIYAKLGIKQDDIVNFLLD